MDPRTPTFPASGTAPAPFNAFDASAAVFSAAFDEEAYRRFSRDAKGNVQIIVRANNLSDVPMDMIQEQFCEIANSFIESRCEMSKIIVPYDAEFQYDEYSKHIVILIDSCDSKLNTLSKFVNAISFYAEQVIELLNDWLVDKEIFYEKLFMEVLYFVGFSGRNCIRDPQDPGDWPEDFAPHASYVPATDVSAKHSIENGPYGLYFVTKASYFLIYKGEDIATQVHRRHQEERIRDARFKNINNMISKYVTYKFPHVDRKNISSQAFLREARIRNEEFYANE